MKTEVPAEIKATLPPSFWGKVLGMTPVVMTVIATLLAGLASSEMTKAQYQRALGAQQQAKAGDQWGFFQAKRLRGAIQSGTLDVMQLTTRENAIDEAGLRALAATLPKPEPSQQALNYLLAGRLPEFAAAPAFSEQVQAALAALDGDLTDPVEKQRIDAPKPKEVAAALKTAQEHARAFDRLMQPIVDGGDALGELLEPTTTQHPELGRDFAVLRLRYSSMRYDAEARLNQRIAVLHELQVRQSNLAAERHHRRSTRFFFGMLGAQAAVIIATLAMAARARNLLWSLAAAAGVGALLFAGYVFLFI
ncbi:hypothetical protein [Opitutus terrae]|uniref:Transmembrane protein n=1 Tax=Opitutus terrae (strain DSM 11246 / JCM 15787 / PB90-1) TaxID=452637 RepID=B1ZPP1_OPITP|nr:hypothetical protein [Opitutus terrae]ACB75494.1 hypothetical protein Oter_2211 [Opitutus terrae PB90-1]